MGDNTCREYDKQRMPIIQKNIKPGTIRKLNCHLLRKINKKIQGCFLF